MIAGYGESENISFTLESIRQKRRGCLIVDRVGVAGESSFADSEFNTKRHLVL